jgi:3-mercaptopyruvate sulfurtransferase SseA
MPSWTIATLAPWDCRAVIALVGWWLSADNRAGASDRAVLKRQTRAGPFGHRSVGMSRLESTISTAELRRRLTQPDLTIVDVRPLAAYNGWHPAGEARGGHIPGADAFPSAWLTRLDDVEVVRLLHAKGIVPGREVVLYGDEASASAARLAELGHAALRVYEQGWGEWAADETLPVERLPNYQRLVDTDWLRQLLDGGRPEAAPARGFLLFQVNFGLPEEYEENHLPGALYTDTNRLESPTIWNRRSPEELAAAVRALGISYDTTVILYGRDTAGEASEKWPGRRLLVIIDRALSQAEREALTRALIAEHAGWPGRVDLRVITRDAAVTPSAAPPMELYLGLRPGANPEIVSHHLGEADLVVELSVCRERGTAVLGAAPGDLIGAVPHRWVLGVGDAQLAHWQALADDAQHAVLMVLTACRIGRFSETYSHCSKSEAGAWALKRDPSLQAVRAALRQRAGDPTRIEPADIARLLTIARARIAATHRA